MVILNRFACTVLFFGIVLTFLFWWPLYGGAGFIGGDLYPYFFPQKAFYADHLKQGEFPLWNDLAGFGYPVLGESQTGAAYPFHLLFYRCLDLNTAYNTEHLLHYVLCFVAAALFSKRVGLTDAGAGLTALVFTYGWFPPRACLEWAILTGAWMPLALWCVESFLQTRLWRYSIGLSLTLGMQLLAGHYHLAFVTQLLVASYSCTRLWIEQHQRRTETCRLDQRCGTRAFMALALAGIGGILLSSVQLLPTWELKQRSSRVVSGGDYDPAYGHMPPLYATQLIAPWCWYSPLSIDEDNIVRDMAEFAAPWHWFGPHHDLDVAIQQSRFGALNTGTNKVEAHVYCGVIPTLMALFATIVWMRRLRSRRIVPRTASVIDSTTGYWLIAAVVALVYATGCMLPIGLHLPGFSFFRAPGRYGIVTTLAIGLLAGRFLSYLSTQFSSRFTRGLVLACVYGSTCGDLWLVSRMVKYSYMVSPPAISYRQDSVVRQRLMAEDSMPRLLAPGPNVGNLLGVSCVPWYLGIAPEEYVDPRNAMPQLPKAQSNGNPTPCKIELLNWLSRSGVTHILNFEPLEETSWNAELVWRGVDPLLNRVWGRSEPIYLYRFRSGAESEDTPSFPGRTLTLDGNFRSKSVDWKQSKSGIRRIDVSAAEDGESILVLTELAYPGWSVQRNGIPQESIPSGVFRTVRCSKEGGEFLWTYRPSSFIYGLTLSLITVIVLATLGHLRFWYPHLTEWRPQNRSE